MVEHGEAGHRVSGEPQNGTKAGVRVIDLRYEHLGEAAGLLARCFHANPNFVDLFPGSLARSRALPRMFAASLRDAFGFGHVYAATRGVEGATRDELAGVAVWLPPGAFPLSPLRQLRALPDMVNVLVAAPRSIPRLMRFLASVNKLHPAKPYFLETMTE